MAIILREGSTVEKLVYGYIVIFLKSFLYVVLEVRRAYKHSVAYAYGDVIVEAYMASVIALESEALNKEKRTRCHSALMTLTVV